MRVGEKERQCSRAKKWQGKRRNKKRTDDLNVQALPHEVRELVIQYYQEEPGVRMKKGRKHLAEQLGVTANALRIQVSRIRDRLVTCLLDCLRWSRDA